MLPQQDMNFDYARFIDEGYASQQKYAKAAGQPGPLDENLSREDRHAKVIEYMGHLIEETIEARVYVPRRSWKTNEPSFLDSNKNREEFIAECFDILLFHRAILAYAGVTGDEFAEVAARKLDYNSKRKDHITNGTESAPVDPSKELQGDCPSASF
jgi:hypothetical protein